MFSRQTIISNDHNRQSEPVAFFIYICFLFSCYHEKVPTVYENIFKGHNTVIFIFALLSIGFILIGKNLLLLEQILPFQKNLFWRANLNREAKGGRAPKGSHISVFICCTEKCMWQCKQLILLLSCSNSHNDVCPEPHQNVSIAAVQGAVHPSIK